MTEVRNSFGAKMARMISFFRAHKRTITFLLILVPILVLGAFLIADAELFLLFVVALLFIPSQIFWLKRIIDVRGRLPPGPARRARRARTPGLAYRFLIARS